MKARRFILLGLQLFTFGIATTSCAGDKPATGGPTVVRAGEKTAVEVAVPTSLSAGASDKAVLLELKNVKLPVQVEGLRVFVVTVDVTGREKAEYVTSVSRGHVTEGNPPESFAVELTPSLKRLQAPGAPLLESGKLKLLLEPISRANEATSESVQVGEFELRAE